MGLADLDWVLAPPLTDCGTLLNFSFPIYKMGRVNFHLTGLF